MTDWVTVSVGGQAWRARRTLDGRLEVGRPDGRTEVLGAAHHARGAHGLLGPKDALPDAVEAAVASEERRIAEATARRVADRRSAREERVRAALARIEKERKR